MRSVEELEDAMSTPRPRLVEDLAGVDGDLVIIGAGGKLGPSLTRLAVRASREAGSSRRVIAVSRFSDAGLRSQLAAIGAETLCADIGDDAALAALPDADNVIYLVGAKFGTAGNEDNTWYTNTVLPARVMQRYSASRVVALSTGNVYPFVAAATGGCAETVPPNPVGEYAMSCLGRERVISHVAQQRGIGVVVVRLNYAVEMRYGVLVDLASTLVRNEPIDVSMGQVNLVWQGYANEVVLRALRHTASPPLVLNVAGPETVSVRQLASTLALQLGVEVRFIGVESETALLSDASRCHGLFGYPRLALAQLVEHTADWIGAGRPTHGKPTGFNVRDGQF